MKFKKSLLVITTCMLIMTSVTVHADPLQDKLKQQKADLEKQQTELSKNKTQFEQAQADLDSINANIEKLDEQIDSAKQKLSAIQSQIKSKEKEITKTQQDLKAAEDDMKSTQELFNKRMRSMYINGVNQGYIDIILSTNSFSDLIGRVEVVKSLLSYDKKVINTLNEQKEKIAEKEKVLVSEKQSLDALNRSATDELNSLNISMANQNSLILKAKEREAYYKATISDYSSKISSQQNLINKTLSDIKKAAESVPKPPKTPASSGNVNKSPLPGAVINTPPATSSAVVSYAYTFLGTPYEWGGNGPDTFDCSGFVRYVLAHHGIYITRTTYTQINEGTAVSEDNLKPGDLIFFGDPGNPHHVGMYIGNNLYIHAPHTGDVVKISPLNRSDFLCARRFIN